MTHYEERLEDDLRRIRRGVLAVSAKIERALEDSVRSVLTGDRTLAYATVLGDLPINRDIRELDRLCHAFVARHLPSARHLRFVSSMLRLNVALERIGDYAVAVSREGVQLSEVPPSTVRRDIERLAEQTHQAMAQAMRAFAEGNAELARGTMGMAEQIARGFEDVLQDLQRAGELGKRPIKDLLALLVVLNRLSRVGDQAKNICEETLFTVTGETKAPKVYRILFVDETNDCGSQMAEAFARKAFPDSGIYSSAGWAPAAALGPEFRSFMERHGYDLRGVEPKPLAAASPTVADAQVIVALVEDAAPHLPTIPFHAALLEWELGGGPGRVAGDETGLTEIYARLAQRIEGLIFTLRGDDAS